MATKQKSLPFPFEYIAEIDSLLEIRGVGKTSKEFLDIKVLKQAMAVRAASQIRETSKLISESLEPAKVKDNEIFAQMKLNMVRAHIKAVGFFIFL
jgi:hypothetical protein